jgi:hypothetical protein
VVSFTSRPLYPRGKSPRRNKNYWPHQDLNSDTSVVQPVASRYTDCSIPALVTFVSEGHITQPRTATISWPSCERFVSLLFNGELCNLSAAEKIERPSIFGEVCFIRQHLPKCFLQTAAPLSTYYYSVKFSSFVQMQMYL